MTAAAAAPDRAPLPARFWVLFGALAVSGIGDGFLSLVLPFRVYVLTGSATKTGVAFFSELLPGLLLGPLAGALADRMSRRLLVLVSLFMGAAAVPVLLVLRTDTVWLAYLCGAALAASNVLGGPAWSALSVRVAGRANLLRARALMSTVSTSTAILVPAAGGALYAAAGFDAVVLVDEATFVVAMAIFGMAARSAGTAMATAAGERLVAAILNGFRVIRRTPLLLGLAAAAVLLGGVDKLVGVAFVPFVRTDLGLDAGSYGTLESAIGIGALAGSAGLAVVADRVRARPLLAAGLLAAGGIIALYTVVRSFPAVIAVSAAMGVIQAVVGAAAMTMALAAVDDDMLGRISGTIGSLQAASGLAAVAVAGPLTDAVGAAGSMRIGGALFALGSLLAIPMRVPGQAGVRRGHPSTGHHGRRPDADRPGTPAPERGVP